MHGGERMNKHYDINLIKQYLAGELSVKEMHALERAALDDPFLQDALEGFETHTQPVVPSLNLLQKRLDKRISKERRLPDNLFFGRQGLTIASVAAVLFILACILFWMINYPMKKDTNNAQQDVSIQASPSIEATLKSGDLEPLIGWKEYNQYLSVYLQENNVEGSSFNNEVQVTLKLIDGRPKFSQFNSTQLNPIEKEMIIQMISDGPDWKGTEGILAIQFKQ